MKTHVGFAISRIAQENLNVVSANVCDVESLGTISVLVASSSAEIIMTPILKAVVKIKNVLIVDLLSMV